MTTRQMAARMINRLYSLFPRRHHLQEFRLPPGRRIYAVGDVHGRLDLFNALIGQIEADESSREPAETTIVLLGDLVDRGPDSSGVVEAAMALAARREVRVLKGNHEEMFERALADQQALRHFLRVGGRETVLSYGIGEKAYRTATIEELAEMLDARVPQAHRDFIAGMENMIALGDYLFVHAGILPGVPLAEQKTTDLRWIREPFLSHPDPFGACVVHGHTITDAVVERPNRVGIDTGAYRSGRLTAVGLQGSERWFMETTAS